MQSATPTPTRGPVLLLAALLAAGFLVACSDDPDTTKADETESGTDQTSPGGFAGAVLSEPVDVGGVVLPDAAPESAGAPFAMRAQPDGVLIVYFGFTSCPDVCPTTLADLRTALVEVGERSDRVDVAMVTIDPARDRPEDLNAYLDHFFDHWHALHTDDQAALATAESAFGVQARKTKSSGDFYAFDHTATVFAVDPQGRLVLQWPYGTEPQAIADDLDRLLDRNGVLS